MGGMMEVTPKEEAKFATITFSKGPADLEKFMGEMKKHGIFFEEKFEERGFTSVPIVSHTLSAYVLLEGEKVHLEIKGKLVFAESSKEWVFTSDRPLTEQEQEGLRQIEKAGKGKDKFVSNLSFGKKKA